MFKKGWSEKKAQVYLINISQTNFQLFYNYITLYTTAILISNHCGIKVLNNVAA